MRRDEVGHDRRDCRAVQIDGDAAHSSGNPDGDKRRRKPESDEADCGAGHPDDDGRAPANSIREHAADRLRHERARAETRDQHTGDADGKSPPPNQIEREKRLDHIAEPVDDRTNPDDPECAWQISAVARPPRAPALRSRAREIHDRDRLKVRLGRLQVLAEIDQPQME